MHRGGAQEEGKHGHRQDVLVEKQDDHRQARQARERQHLRVPLQDAAQREGHVPREVAMIHEPVGEDLELLEEGLELPELLAQRLVANRLPVRGGALYGRPRQHERLHGLGEAAAEPDAPHLAALALRPLDVANGDVKRPVPVSPEAEQRNVDSRLLSATPPFVAEPQLQGEHTVRVVVHHRYLRGHPEVIRGCQNCAFTFERLQTSRRCAERHVAKPRHNSGLDRSGALPPWQRRGLAPHRDALDGDPQPAPYESIRRRLVFSRGLDRL
mmetsp:Transcript_95764/g.276619  ORF Transcript_95764/g.276619 Transcript_95764/m.276619 type:complete len:270 (+) Transcript_95764:653-1462(+)